MTFILAGMNRRFAVQVSDRRLTSNGALVDDEASKAFTLMILGFGLTVAFTGLARFKGFNTYDFLLNCLPECGPPDFQPVHILERLAVRLNEEFARYPLHQAPANSKKLTISLVGFNATYDPPKAIAAQISNGTWGGRIGPFAPTFWQVKETHESSFDWLGAFGDGRALDVIGESHLRSLLQSGITMRNFAELLSDRVRKVATDPRTQGGVGRQLDVICLPSDPSHPVLAYHLSMTDKMEVLIPGSVVLHPSGSNVIAKIEIRTDSDTPLTIGKVNKNAPCPCGSGKRFKHCHREFSQ
jgi:hypothetical protein